ncbi:hypothetical protein THIOKS13200011 [Thiocapsa sp. KS1]|nr:hypothetical protein THIOKS13200011 [Thiocapsa sp. KS1]
MRSIPRAASHSLLAFGRHNAVFQRGRTRRHLHKAVAVCGDNELAPGIVTGGLRVGIEVGGADPARLQESRDLGSDEATVQERLAHAVRAHPDGLARLHPRGRAQHGDDLHAIDDIEALRRIRSGLHLQHLHFEDRLGIGLEPLNSIRRQDRVGFPGQDREQRETGDSGISSLCGRGHNDFSCWRLKPVIERQIRDARELPRVVGHQGRAVGDGRGGDEGIERADRCARLFQITSDQGRCAGFRFCKREEYGRVDQRFELPATLVRMRRFGDAGLQLMQDDRGDSQLRGWDGQQAASDMSLAFEKVDQRVGVEQVHQNGSRATS